MPRRRLRPTEIREAESVFGGEIDYRAVWIHEGARWPQRLAALFARPTRRSRPKGMTSVTLGRHLFFPWPLHTDPDHLDAGLYGDTAWLLYEMTHLWQARHGGFRSVAGAIRNRLRLGPAAADYGGPSGLQAAAAKHASLADFNPEQQGEIVRDFYLRRRMGLATAPWESFVAELRAA